GAGVYLLLVRAGGSGRGARRGKWRVWALPRRHCQRSRAFGCSAYRQSGTAEIHRRGPKMRPTFFGRARGRRSTIQKNIDRKACKAQLQWQLCVCLAAPHSPTDDIRLVSRPAFVRPSRETRIREHRTIVKERICLDKANRDLLHDEITTINDALTRPWMVARSRDDDRRCCRSARYSIFLLVPVRPSFYFARSVTRLTHLSRVPPLKSGTATSTWRQEADMAPKPDRLAFIFGMVLAMAVTIPAITTWAAPPDPESRDEV